MAGLDEPNFDLFGSFGLEFLGDELLTETSYLTEQTETTETGGVATITEQTEQTESGQLNDEDPCAHNEGYLVALLLYLPNGTAVKNIQNPLY